MAISKKILMIAFIATSIPFAICSEEQQPETAKVFNLAQSLKKTGAFLARSLGNAGDSYEKFSEKVQPYCNPISMAATAFGASFLTRKQFASLTVAVITGIYSKNIAEAIKKQSPTIKEKFNEKLGELDRKVNKIFVPASVDQGQNNSHQNGQNSNPE